MGFYQRNRYCANRKHCCIKFRILKILTFKSRKKRPSFFLSSTRNTLTTLVESVAYTWTFLYCLSRCLLSITQLEKLALKLRPTQTSCSADEKFVEVLRSESLSGKCAKLHIVAASNNKDYMPWSLLLVRTTYIWVLFFAHISFVVNRTFNATSAERLQQR